MENLNAETIKKAMECCQTPNADDCEKCEYRRRGNTDNSLIGCCNILVADALALITSQEQRIGAQDMTISELRQRCEKAEHDASRYEQRIKELTGENKKLTVNMNAYGLTAKRLAEENERLRADTLEEYRKGIYRKMEKYTVFGREYIQRIMREVEKEMVGDKDV